MFRKEVIRSWIVVLMASIFAIGCEAIPTSEPETVVFLVRHAEKLKGPDPSLSPEGIVRADVLAERLEGEGLQFIHSTDYARTRETAAPIAEKTGLQVRLYDPRDLPAFAEQLRAEKGRHLVVGHSNTTPSLVEALGGMESTPIYEPTEYDRLYIVKFYLDGGVDSELERYGDRYKADW